MYDDDDDARINASLLSTLSNSMYDDNDNETIIEKEFFSIPIFSYPRNSEIALKFNCEQIAQFR